jgi:hypothetical protein
MSYPKSRLGKLFIKKADLLRELDSVLNAIEDDLVTTSGDGSIVNNAGDVRVGILATDAQHGNRGGGTTHAVATTTVAGFMSAADKVGLGNAQTTLANIVGETKEPTGFPNRTDTTVSFDDGTHTLTIAPTGVSYEIFHQGTAIVKTAPESYPWPDVEGLHLIYFDASGVLTSTQNPNTISNIFTGEGVAVAAVYWDATNNVTLRRIEERHGTGLSGSTHIYLHRYFGTAYESGGALSGFSIVAGAPSTAAAAQFAVDNTVVADEDIRFSIVTGLPQVLTPVAQIPIFYLTGTGIWRKKTADAYPLLYSGTAGYVGANGRLPWNQFSAGTWSLTQVANNDFVLMHYFATTDLVEPIIGVVGQNTYTSLALARAGATTEINTILGLASLLSTEKRALGTVIYQSANLYTNVPKAKVVVTDTGANYIDWRATTFNSGLIGTGSQAVTASLIAGAYAAAWAIPDWYIDGVVGSDSNSGVLVGAPLQTGAELLRRLGPYAIWPQSVTVHVGVNGMTDGLVLRGCLLVAGTHLDILGTPTILASDTILTYAAVNHATPTATQITATGLADWSSYRWRRIRITSGARIDTVCFIAKASPGGLGTNVARVSVPVALNLTSTTLSRTGAITLIAGDPFDIESLPIVESVDVTLDGPIGITIGPVYAQRQFSVQNVSTRELTINATSVITASRCIVFGCRLSNTRWLAGINFNLAQQAFWGCSFFNDDPASPGIYKNFGKFEYCLLGEGTATRQIAGGPILAFSSLWQDMGFTNVLEPADITGCQFFDSPAACLAGYEIDAGRSNNISGSGHANYGILQKNSVIAEFRGVTNVVGALGDVRLSTNPPITLTTAQFLVPSDWAQKGIATLVAGTVTVTVPWWDPTVQRLTFGRNTPSGVIGDLSAPTASRTNTQFVINSSNVADTSTIDWEISPLGRNIFVSTT